MNRRSALHSRPKFAERREHYARTSEASLLASLCAATLLVWLSPTAEPEVIFLPPTNISIEIMDVPQTRQPLLVKGAPVKPIIPIASDIMEELLTEETDVLFGTEEGLLEIPAMPIPPGKKDKADYRPPKLMVSKFPEYPKELQKQGVQGTVILTIKIDVDGKVIDHKVKKNSTGSDLLEKLAVATVYKCKFAPAYEGKKPIVAWTEHTFEFNDTQNGQ